MTAKRHNPKGRLVSALVLIAAFALLAGTATAGLVSSLGVTKRTISGKPTTIVVDRRGDTVYELGGESLSRLQCITAQCLKQWPPVLVRSASVKVSVASGVPGRLTILTRVKAKLFQVMLDNHPLYFYLGDTKIGDTKGQGLKGPGGGAWHVVKGK
jgi:predicted lipoprotein with Yx(FWY)xxD motif